MFVLAKGPSPTARDLFVRSVRETSAIGFLANIYFTDEETADTTYNFICLALGALGFVALLIYISKYKSEFNRIISKNGLEEYSLKQKVSKFIFAPAMIIAIIVFLIQAISMISFGSGVSM